jgi:hypothetical protein
MMAAAYLAQALVGQADHRDVLNGRVLGGEEVLDLHRVQVLATRS